MGGDDAYDHVVRGKLSLKGVAVKGGVGKKEKKRSKKEKREKKEKKESREEGGRADGSGYVDTRTKAEKAYEEAYKKAHEARMIKDMASKSHKDKVREFNEKLSKLTEHHDLPKVGPG